MADPSTAQAVELAFKVNGFITAVGDNNLMVEGDIAAMFIACLEDAEAAYHNDNDALKAKYGADVRKTMHG